jgi:hypothetical protein
MREYGKVYTAFWGSPTITAMSDDGKLMALYLMTCPHNTIAGVFRLPDGYVEEDMKWGLDRVSRGFAELFRNGFANRCETTKWVWIAKHLDWNPPENPNQRKAARKVVLSIPQECLWKAEYMLVCSERLGFEPIENRNPSETVPEPFLNQEQEQEQEQEQLPPLAPEGLVVVENPKRGKKKPLPPDCTPETLPHAQEVFQRIPRHHPVTGSEVHKGPFAPMARNMQRIIDANCATGEELRWAGLCYYAPETLEEQFPALTGLAEAVNRAWDTRPGFLVHGATFYGPEKKPWLQILPIARKAMAKLQEAAV